MGKQSDVSTDIQKEIEAIIKQEIEGLFGKQKNHFLELIIVMKMLQQNNKFDTIGELNRLKDKIRELDRLRGKIPRDLASVPSKDFIKKVEAVLPRIEERAITMLLNRNAEIALALKQTMTKGDSKKLSEKKTSFAPLTDEQKKAYSSALSQVLESVVKHSMFNRNQPSEKKVSQEHSHTPKTPRK